MFTDSMSVFSGGGGLEMNKGQQEQPTYTPPEIRTLDARQLMEALGPAMCGGYGLKSGTGGGIYPTRPKKGR